MDMEVDHYALLGLPSGEEGAKLSEKEISKAYHAKALELHPDKRPDDPDAHANFQKLKTSYEILKDDKYRKLFDGLLRVKHEKLQYQSQQDSKRRKMMSDLEERERAASAPSDSTMKARNEEERYARQLKEGIARILAVHAADKAASKLEKKEAQAVTGGQENVYGGEDELEKERTLKLSWRKDGEDYSKKELRQLFEMCGEVEYVILGGSKKKGSAVIVMASKDAAIAAARNGYGHLSNSIAVVPLQPQ